jgi:hypothetical protein
MSQCHVCGVMIEHRANPKHGTIWFDRQNGDFCGICLHCKKEIRRHGTYQTWTHDE